MALIPLAQWIYSLVKMLTHEIWKRFYKFVFGEVKFFRILLRFSFLRAAIQFNKNLSNLGCAIYLRIFHGMLSSQYQHFQSFNPWYIVPFRPLNNINLTFNVRHCPEASGSGSNANLDEISSSESRPRVIYKISTKDQPEDTDQTSASKACLNFNFKILIKLQNTDQTSASKLAFKLQNLDKTLCSKSEQRFGIMIKPQLPNLQQTFANTMLIINISNSNNLKYWVGIFTRQGNINQVY